MQNKYRYDHFKLTMRLQKDFIEKNSQYYEAKILQKKRFEHFIMFDHHKTTNTDCKNYRKSIQD